MRSLSHHSSYSPLRARRRNCSNKNLARRQHSRHCQRGLGFGHGLHGRVVGEVLEASAVGAHDVVMDDEPLGDALAAKNAGDAIARESIAARAQPLFDPCGRSREMLMVRRPKTNSPMKVLLPEPDGPGITKMCLSALAAATLAARSPRPNARRKPVPVLMAKLLLMLPPLEAVTKVSC